MSDVPVKRLYQGVSTQPGWRKFPGAVKDAGNVVLDIVVGAATRMHTDHVANIVDGGGDPIVDPGDTVRFTRIGTDTIIVGPDGVGGLKFWAFDSAGNELTISDPDTIGHGYLGSDVSAIRFASKEDTALVLNRTTVPALLDAPTGTVISKVNTYDDLPAAPTLGDIHQVRDDWNAFPHGYYKCTDVGPPVVWERIAKPDQANARLDDTTMPHRLIRDGAGGFYWKKFPYPDRLSGDELTNPPPGWALYGRPILTVAFHQGRTMLCDSETIASSRANDYGNFFVDNVNAPTDADPISIDVAQDGGTLLWSVSIDSVFFLGFEKLQIEFTSWDRPLSNVNGQQRLIGSWPMQDLEPGAGDDRLYLADTSNGIHLWEYGGPAAGLREVKPPPSDHARHPWLTQYTYNGLHVLDGTLYIRTAGGKVLVYQRYIMDERLAQSAWSRLEFYGQVRYMFGDGDHLVLWESADGHYTLTDYQPRLGPPSIAALEVEVRLDRRELLTGVYDSGTDRTTYSMATPADLDATRLVLTTGDAPGREIEPVAISGNDAIFTGDWSADQHYVGRLFESYLVLEQLYFDARRQIPIVRTVSTFHVDTTDYQLEFDYPGRSTMISRFETESFNAVRLETGRTATGHHVHLVGGDARQMRLTLRHITTGQAIWSALELNVEMGGM